MDAIQQEDMEDKNREYFWEIAEEKKLRKTSLKRYKIIDCQ